MHFLEVFFAMYVCLIFLSFLFTFVVTKPGDKPKALYKSTPMASFLDQQDLVRSVLFSADHVLSGPSLNVYGIKTLEFVSALCADQLLSWFSSRQ